jgi:hypothetical protein
VFLFFGRFKVQRSLNLKVAMFSSQQSYLKRSFIASLQHAGLAVDVAKLTAVQILLCETRDLLHPLVPLIVHHP